MIVTLSLSKLLSIQITITKSVSIMDKVRPGLVGTTGISVNDKKGAFQRAPPVFRNWITGNKAELANQK